MTASPSRGMLYPTLPDYDVFEKPRSGTSADAAGTSTDETTVPAETEATETPGDSDESSAPVMARANWTGTVSADD